ncbi:hypothetical protein [Streptomyces sp. NBC_00286]|uniref:hypothetical protein n=1 Tax=Streptomyces sp. NBC_00286 TaxID=2975701 RepID=UPI002E2D10C2|nr:hypothetical protein [Streptomyces sp. NBC_00286]
MTHAMTNEQILAVCRSNWEYRGIDDASVREMLDELTAHLEDAEAAGRTPQDVVGGDVRAFAATWARARAPLALRVLRMVAMTCSVFGVVLLFSCLFHWTGQVELTVDRIAFYVLLAAVTVVWETRRGSLGIVKNWALTLVVVLPAALLTRWLVGDEVLFTLQVWFIAALLLPGLAYVVSDKRNAKAATADSE